MRLRVMLAAAATLAVALTTGCSDSNAADPAPVTVPTVSSPAQPVQSHVQPDASIASLPAVGPEKSEDGLTAQVVGECGAPGSTGLHLKASGFTPNSQYQTEAYYPEQAPWNGARYTNLASNGYGTAATDGSTPAWTWECYLGPGSVPDPPGEYKLVMHDTTTGRSVSTTFTVAYDGS